MKKLLIGLLVFGSISSYANNCTYRVIAKGNPGSLTGTVSRLDVSFKEAIVTKLNKAGCEEIKEKEQNVDFVIGILKQEGYMENYRFLGLIKREESFRWTTAYINGQERVRLYGNNVTPDQFASGVLDSIRTFLY